MNRIKAVEFAQEKLKYKVTRLQDKCPECGKVAREKFAIDTVDKNTGDTIRLITLECYHVIRKVIPKGTPFDEFITAEHRDNDCAHDWDKNHCPKCGAFRLFDFQVTGAQFIETALAINRGAALFDEMGLGKTVQPLAYLFYHEEALPALFIVKSGIMFQFFKEIIRWLGPNYLSQTIRTSRDPILKGLKTYIVSYDLLRRLDIQDILDAGIKTIILDECQQIKNPDSSRTQMVRKIAAKVDNVIPLSGTPWKNRGSEFFTVLNMLNPMKFPSYQGYLDRWVRFFWDGGRYKEGGIRRPKEFKAYIADIALRRERSEVMSELPLINRTMHFTELDDLSQETYNSEVSDFVKWYNNEVIGGDENSIATQQNMLARLARMRHIAGLAKIPVTVEFVTEHIKETGRKIVVFVHHIDVGQLIYDQLKTKHPDIPVFKLTSTMNSDTRFFDVQEPFNKCEGAAILVASTLAAGEGLNLQSCSDCILHERQWNPANEEQAEGRFIRIGQTANSVNGTYITASGTVDEHLANLVERKRQEFHAAMNKGEIPIWNQAGMIQELAESIMREASKLKKMVTM